MKKIGKLVAMLIAVMLVATFFTACTKDEDIVGNWEFYSMEANGKALGMDFSMSLDVDDLENLDELGEIQVSIAETFTTMNFEFKDDGTVISDMSDEGGTYEMDGSKVVMLDDEGEPEDMEGFSLKVNGSYLIMTGEMKEAGMELNITVKFSKVK